jgi:hypothetical protein
MSFAIVDNLKVMSYTDLPPTPPSVPNITSIQVVGNDVVINFTGGASDVAGDFSLQSSAVVNTGYADTGATINGGSGVFQTTLPVNGATRFYRIKR